MTMSYSQRRQGLAIVMALAVMAVLTVVLSVVTLQIVNQRKLMVQRQHQLQSEWLARAGIEVAAARLLDSAVAFTDDKQQLVPDSKLDIVVEKLRQDEYTVVVEAEVGRPDEHLKRARSASARLRRSVSKEGVRVQSLPE